MQVIKTIIKNKWTQAAVGLALGLFLLWFLFREVDWTHVGHAISRASWGWLTLSVVMVFVSFFTRVQRWSYIVRTAGPVSYRHLFSATQVGFLANFVLPARAGEPIRALMLSRLTGIPFTRSFAFVALDRVTDLFGLLAVLLVSVLTFRPQHDINLPPIVYGHPIPASIVNAMAIQVALVIILLVGALVLLYARQQLFLRMADAVVGLVSQPLAERVHGWGAHFADGLHVFRSLGDMLKAIVWSLITWGAFLITYGSLARAFGMDLPWYAPFLMSAFLAMAVSMPGAPGFIGQFHFGLIVPTFLLMNVDMANPDAVNAAYNETLALAIVGHLINVGPVFVAGLWSLWAENAGLLQLQRESEAAQAETGESPAGNAEKPSSL